MKQHDLIQRLHDGWHLEQPISVPGCYSMSATLRPPDDIDGQTHKVALSNIRSMMSGEKPWLVKRVKRGGPRYWVLTAAGEAMARELMQAALENNC